MFTPRKLACGFGLLCLLFTAHFLRAAGDLSVTGTLRDPSGATVPDATLSLYSFTSLAGKAVTGPDGRFFFTGLHSGAYILEWHKEGFRHHSRRLSLEESSLPLDLSLELAGLDQHVMVIAAELPQLAGEVSKAASTISAQELADQDVVFLTDSLRQIPSLQIQQLGGPGNLASYRFRGLRPQDTAILLDGFQFRDSSDIQGASRPFLGDLLATDVERIEVLRGASSVLYGTNAVGGVIQVTPTEPTRPLEGFASFQGGSLGLLQGGGGLSGLAVRRQLAYSLRADHVNYTRGLDDNDTYRNSSGTGRLRYDLGPRARITGRFYLIDSFLFLNESPSPLDGLPELPAGQSTRRAVAFPEAGANFHPQFDDPDSHRDNRSYNGALRLTAEILPQWNLSAGYQRLVTQRRFDDGPAVSADAAALGFGEGGRHSNFGSTIHEFTLRNTIAWNRANTASVGLDFDRVSLDQTSFGLTTEAAQRSLAVSLHNQTRLLGGRLQFQAGFRAQRYALDSPRFSDATQTPYGSVSSIDVPSTYNGDVSGAYFIAGTGTKVRLHAGNGFRSPSLFERFGAGGSGIFLSYFGNPQLRPERTIYVDGGLDQFLFGDRLELSATYFYTHLKTFIDFSSTPDDRFGRSFGYLNFSGGNARGAEFSFSARPGRVVNFRGTYTYSKSNQPLNASGIRTWVLGLANHQVTLGMNLRPHRRLNLNLQAFGMSDHEFPLFGIVFAIPRQTYRFPGFLRLDLTGSYVLYDGERSKVRFVTRIDNLLNREYFQGGYLAPKATVRSGLHFEF